MKQSETMTVAQAVNQWPFELEVPSGDSAPSKWWSFMILGFKVYCYNFKWRQQAIAHHDLHHIVTGYPCTLIGEMQLATWEFAAGRFPNIYANLFCLPLVAVGTVLIPGKLWAAFRHGRQSQSLFNTPITGELLNSKVNDLRAEVAKTSNPRADRKDILVFGFLAGVSWLVVLLPALAGVLLLALLTTV